MKKNPLIGIIGGRGKMGQYFQSFFKSLGHEVIVSDHKTKLTNIELAQKADVVIISVPIAKTIEVIQEVTPHVRPNALLTDFTSIKVEPVQEMLKGQSEVIGCHPIFGPFSGMKNQVLVLCPARAKKWLPWFKKIIKNGGGKIKILTPAEHDKLMAVVQVLTHFSDITLAHALKEIGIPLKSFLECQSPPYRLKLDMMGRILDQDPELYGSILLSNPDRVKVIKKYLQSEQKLLEIAEKQDLPAFVKYFQTGAKYLGEFRHTAMRESNYLVDKLNQLISIAHQKTKPQPTDLAVLGPANTYTDLAAQKYDATKNRYFCQSIAEVFAKVKSGTVPEGIIPIDNLDMGAVRETLDELFQSKVYIKKEITLAIDHCLVAVPQTNLRQIKVVLSKEEAIAQCSRFLHKTLPKAKLMPTTSTAEAMQKIIRENLHEAAALGDKNAAEKMGLKILRENIGNNPENKTRFIVISKRKHSPVAGIKNIKTSLAVYFDKDKPGSLYLILREFARESVNLTKIETRPVGKMFGEYIFFIDFSGNLKDKNVQRVMKKIETKVAGCRIFGSYEVVE